MKQKFVLVLCTVFIIVLAACGGSKFPLNGVWTASMYGEEISLLLIDDLSYFMYDDEIEKTDSFTFEKDSGTIRFWGERMNFTVKGNVMTATMDGETLIFNKDTKTKAAPNSVGGAWYGPSRWVLAIINNMIIIIDEDNDLDYGTFTVNGNSGSFECDGWLKGTFEVKSGKLTLNETGYFKKSIEFTRTR